MATVGSRTKDIARSHSGKQETVNNYESTIDRIDDAISLLSKAQEDSRDATIVALNYMNSYYEEKHQWLVRVKVVEELIRVGGVESEIQLKPIMDIAQKMSNNAEAQCNMWAERGDHLVESEKDMKRREDELTAAKGQLRLAQSLIDSRQRLEALASSVVVPGEMDKVSTGSILDPVDLRKITALTHEAEALAELKGWSVR